MDAHRDERSSGERTVGEVWQAEDRRKRRWPFRVRTACVSPFA